MLGASAVGRAGRPALWNRNGGRAARGGPEPRKTRLGEAAVWKPAAQAAAADSLSPTRRVGAGLRPCAVGASQARNLHNVFMSSHEGAVGAVRKISRMSRRFVVRLRDVGRTPSLVVAFAMVVFRRPAGWVVAAGAVPLGASTTGSRGGSSLAATVISCFTHGGRPSPVRTAQTRVRWGPSRHRHPQQRQVWIRPT